MALQSFLKNSCWIMLWIWLSLQLLTRTLFSALIVYACSAHTAPTSNISTNTLPSVNPFKTWFFFKSKALDCALKAMGKLHFQLCNTLKKDLKHIHITCEKKKFQNTVSGGINYRSSTCGALWSISLQLFYLHMRTTFSLIGKPYPF